MSNFFSLLFFHFLCFSPFSHADPLEPLEFIRPRPCKTLSDCQQFSDSKFPCCTDSLCTRASDNGKCMVDSVCTSDKDCAAKKAICPNGVCVKISCSDNCDEIAPEGAYCCSDFYCLPNHTGNTDCEKYCLTNNDCHDDQLCYSNRCVENYCRSTDTCLAKFSQVNYACCFQNMCYLTNSHDILCKAGSLCSSASQCQSKCCRKDLTCSDGPCHCSEPTECSLNQCCVGGLCKKQEVEGQVCPSVCKSTSTCAPGYYCKENVCLALPPQEADQNLIFCSDFDSCFFKSTGQNGCCNFGICQERFKNRGCPLGSLCKNQTDCPSGNCCLDGICVDSCDCEVDSDCPKDSPMKCISRTCLLLGSDDVYEMPCNIVDECYLFSGLSQKAQTEFCCFDGVCREKQNGFCPSNQRTNLSFTCNPCACPKTFCCTSNGQCADDTSECLYPPVSKVKETIQECVYQISNCTMNKDCPFANSCCIFGFCIPNSCDVAACFCNSQCITGESSKTCSFSHTSCLEETSSIKCAGTYNEQLYTCSDGPYKCFLEFDCLYGKCRQSTVANLTSCDPCLCPSFCCTDEGVCSINPHEECPDTYNNKTIQDDCLSRLEKCEQNKKNEAGNCSKGKCINKHCYPIEAETGNGETTQKLVELALAILSFLIASLIIVNLICFTVFKVYQKIQKRDSRKFLSSTITESPLHAAKKAK